MPKSKRNKLVTLSKTKKKGREHKESLVASLRKAVDEYSSLYVFEFENMRNSLFKELRDRLKSSSRFFMGSIKVLQIALGRTDADEIKDGLHKASKFVHGDRGLLLTNLPKEDVLKIFEGFEEHDFARVGSVATETVELDEGPLEQFTHDMEPFLRKQGMPVRLNRGVVELVANYTVCTEGEQISPEASRILRLLEVRMATFRLSLVCRWSEVDFEVYQEDEAQDDSECEDEGEDENENAEKEPQPRNGSYYNLGDSMQTVEVQFRIRNNDYYHCPLPLSRDEEKIGQIAHLSTEPADFD